MPKDCLLGDSLPLKNTDFNKFFLRSIVSLADRCKFEVCGAITDKKLHFFKNISPTPQQTFIVTPRDYVNIYPQIKVFFHSHCLGGATPSGFDILLSQELARPFLIYSNIQKNFSFYCPDAQKLIYFSL
jgi:proteasome lid subunit RPN8/RPN11